MNMKIFRHGRVDKQPRIHLEVTEDEALEKLRGHGFDPFFWPRQMRVGDPETGRGYAQILDQRKLPAAYRHALIVSIYDGDGHETHRYVVPRR